ncbi:MAG: UPF0489 family protein [Phycisphaerae bacterium]|jgi:hypothetical protein|nr:UPF0489 family protein [Phycisphaerae bacterium]
MPTSLLVLDIDLDLFVTPIKTGGDPDIRPDDDATAMWSEEELSLWLEERCRLSRSSPTSGIVVEEHVSAFDYLRDLVRSGRLVKPFDFVHADAHADFGMGTQSHHTVCCQMLNRDAEDRDDPPCGDRSGLNSSSWLAFAAACRWFRTLTYVHHDDLRPSYHDIPNIYLRGNDIAADSIQLKRFAPIPLDSPKRLADHPPLAFEPAIPLRLVRTKDFRLCAPPTHLIIARSPGYSPLKADRLLRVLESYVRSDA